MRDDPWWWKAGVWLWIALSVAASLAVGRWHGGYARARDLAALEQRVAAIEGIRVTRTSIEPPLASIERAPPASSAVELSDEPIGSMAVLTVSPSSGARADCSPGLRLWIGSVSGARIESRVVGSSCTLARTEDGWVVIAFTGTWTVNE